MPLDPTALCWLDENGKNVWFRHKCKDKIEDHRLPFKYMDEKEQKGWEVINNTVNPSIVCTLCGFHQIMQISPKPND